MSIVDFTWKFIIHRTFLDRFIKSVSTKTHLEPIFGSYNYELEVEYSKENYELTGVWLESVYNLIDTGSLNLDERDLIEQRLGVPINFSLKFEYQSHSIELSIDVLDNIALMNRSRDIVLGSLTVSGTDGNLSETPVLNPLIEGIDALKIISPLIAWSSLRVSISSFIHGITFSDVNYNILASLKNGTAFFRADVWNKLSDSDKQLFLKRSKEHGSLIMFSVDEGVLLRVLQDDNNLNLTRELNFELFELIFKALKIVKIR
jgi:subtilase family serine protease